MSYDSQQPLPIEPNREILRDQFYDGSASFGEQAPRVMPIIDRPVLPPQGLRLPSKQVRREPPPERTTSLKLPRLRLKSRVLPDTPPASYEKLQGLHPRNTSEPAPQSLVPWLHVDHSIPRDLAYTTDFLPRQDIGDFPTLRLPIIQRQTLPVTSSFVAGSNGLNGLTLDPSIDRYDTIPLMVLRGIAEREKQPAPAMHSEIKEAAGNAAIFGAGNVAGSILKYGSNVIMQREFGRPAYGLYSIASALISLIAAVFNLGLDDATLRYTSIYRVKKRPAVLRGLLVFCTLTSGLAGLVGAILVFFFAPGLAELKHDPELRPALMWLAPLIPMLCLQIIWFSGLQGFKAFKWRVLAERIVFPVVMILALIVAVFVYRTVIGIIWANLIGIAVGMIVAFFALMRLIPRVAKGQPSRQYEMKEWLGFAVPNFMTSIIDMTLESIDTLLLALFAISNIEIALYTAAIKLSGFITMPQTSINAMFAPTIAELHSKGEHERLASMFKVVTKWSLTLSLPIFCVAVVFSRPLLSISGQDYVEAWPLLVAFAIGNIINTGTGAVGYLLMMTGHQKVAVINSLSAVGINVLLGVILTPRYGAMGVAISTGMAVAVVNLLRLLQVRIFLKLHPYKWDTLKPVFAGLISSITLGIILRLLDMEHVKLFYGLALIPLFLAMYTGLIILFKLSAEDQIVINALSKKFKKRK
jgi:O-antigen/teichoic acid export membrane protein